MPPAVLFSLLLSWRGSGWERGQGKWKQGAIKVNEGGRMAQKDERESVWAAGSQLHVHINLQRSQTLNSTCLRLNTWKSQMQHGLLRCMSQQEYPSARINTLVDVFKYWQHQTLRLCSVVRRYAEKEHNLLSESFLLHVDCGEISAAKQTASGESFVTREQSLDWEAK